jgi:hypothetical protein
VHAADDVAPATDRTLLVSHVVLTRSLLALTRASRFDFLPGKYWRESIDEFLQQQGTPGAAKL